MFGQILRFIEWLDYPAWVWYLIGIYFFIPIIFYMILPAWNEYSYESNLRNKRQILIVVLGDLGHSPRILYHAKNFAVNKHYKVQLFGYLNSKLPDFILENSDMIEVNEIPALGNAAKSPFGLIFKVIQQNFLLLSIFFKSKFKNSKYVLIQNPPILPILHIMIIWKYLYSNSTRIIIDWHNLNYSILEMKFSERDRVSTKFIGKYLVKIMKTYEILLSKWFARLNITVSENMKEFLLNQCYPNFNKMNKLDQMYYDGLYLVLKDRPASQFKPLTDSFRREKFINEHFSFIFKECIDNDGFDFFKKDKIIISSTSFTKDEDFDILLDAMKLYDLKMEEPDADLPKIFLLVTGKGPEKQKFLRNVENLKFSKRIVIKNYWLSSSDYAKIISVADLAISLHLSSSGIDLPMKILDFFGCGVPTISVNFRTISELVHDGINGLILKENTKLELSEKLIEVLTNKNDIYNVIKLGALIESKNTFDDNWVKSIDGYV